MTTPHKPKPGQPICRTCLRRYLPYYLEGRDICPNSSDVDMSKTCADHHGFTKRKREPKGTT